MKLDAGLNALALGGRGVTTVEASPAPKIASKSLPVFNVSAAGAGDPTAGKVSDPTAGKALG